MEHKMSKERMYKERKANIAAFRGCDFNCCYCAFKKTLSRLNCGYCFNFKPHAHIETLNHKPPKTRAGEFVTIGLTGDISFMETHDFEKVIDYCHEWCNVTFLIQSKRPEYFIPFTNEIPDNVILGTTIESNLLITRNDGVGMYDHNEPYSMRKISDAPSFRNRYEAMLKIKNKKAITIEPILYFDARIFPVLIQDIKPEWVWVGYDSKPEKNHLPEPTLEKTKELIKCLEDAGISVHQKLIRKAWYENGCAETSAEPKSTSPHSAATKVRGME